MKGLGSPLVLLFCPVTITILSGSRPLLYIGTFFANRPWWVHNKLWKHGGMMRSRSCRRFITAKRIRISGLGVIVGCRRHVVGWWIRVARKAEPVPATGEDSPPRSGRSVLRACAAAQRTVRTSLK